jgi:hypothetical protein
MEPKPTEVWTVGTIRRVACIRSVVCNAAAVTYQRGRAYESISRSVGLAWISDILISTQQLGVQEHILGGVFGKHQCIFEHLKHLFGQSDYL